MIAFLSSLVAVYGCDPDEVIPLPASDATVPGGYWVIAPAGTGAQPPLYGTDVRYDLGSEKHVTVAFHVLDRDGGVKRVSIDGAGLSACAQSNVADIAEVTCHAMGTLSPNSSGKVSVDASRGCTLDLSCQKKSGLVEQTFTGPGGTIVFSGQGENFYNGKVASRLTLTTTHD